MSPGRLLLDTKALSALSEDSEAAIAVAGHHERLLLPLPVFAEARYGVLLARSLKPKIERSSRLLEQFPVLAMDRQRGELFASMYADLGRLGLKIPTNDLWIAAIGIQHGLPLMTRDAHFDRIAGLAKIGW